MEEQEEGCTAPTHYDLDTRRGLVVSVTPRPRFTYGERTFSTHWTEGWVGLRVGLDTEVRRKILLPLPGIDLEHPVVQSVNGMHIVD
jgi:hypothetical protein